MINPINTRCTARPGILSVLINGKPEVVAFDSTGTNPLVLRCECDAKQIILRLGIKVAAMSLMGAKLRHPFTPDDFRYDYMDELPKGLDPDVGDCTDAKAALSTIFSKG